MKTLIIIPSRMSATRLPGKPLLKIGGKSIISYVFKRAESANIGEVVVATEDQEIIFSIKYQRVFVLESKLPMVEIVILLTKLQAVFMVMEIHHKKLHSL